MTAFKTENSKIESGRADFALAEVKRVKEIPGVKLKEYKSYCKKFPSMIQANGLAAAAAFALEKRGTWDHIYSHCENWLIERSFFDKSKTFIEYVCALETAQYRIVTREVLALFSWVRRFASGFIEGDE